MPPLKPILKNAWMLLLFIGNNLVLGQNNSTDYRFSEPLISKEKADLLENINISFETRFGFLNHFEKGRSDNFTEYRFSQLGMLLSAQLDEKLTFVFRNRFNRETNVQSLDRLGGNVEMAFMEYKPSERTSILLGKMPAFFGGYEGDANPIDILQFNVIIDNVIGFVTGAGILRDVGKGQTLGLQVLNSRNMRYDDVYKDRVTEEVREPKWPVSVVGLWRGSLWDGQFQTLYSVTYSKVAKGNGGIKMLSLGNKFTHNNLIIMYDLNLSAEQLDTKGIVTNILPAETIAQDVLYFDNWIRADYRFSPQFEASATLMRNDSYGKNIYNENSGTSHLQSSMHFIPAFYFRPVEKINFKLYTAYIGNYVHFSDYALEQIQAPNYQTGELRIGFIANLKFL